MENSMISALLLAAGESKRMGATKQLLAVLQEPMLARSLKNLQCPGIGEIVLVLGHDHEKIRETLHLDETTLKIALNNDFARGMSSSIAAGLSIVSPDSTGVLIALGDQPLIRPATITALIEDFKSSKKGIAIASYKGRRGHPVIFSRHYYEELKNLSGVVGARSIIQRNPEDSVFIELDDNAILIDIDTPEDLNEVRRGFA
jgi:molybdenum cofactor cytidylyltransferase